MRSMEVAARHLVREAREVVAAERRSRSDERDAARKARNEALAARRLGSDEAPWLAATNHHREHFARTGAWVATEAPANAA